MILPFVLMDTCECFLGWRWKKRCGGSGGGRKRWGGDEDGDGRRWDGGGGKYEGALV